MEHLRGRLSGLGIPTFVVDAPQGGGKIPLLPTYVVSVSPTRTVLRNPEGMLIEYPEPSCATEAPARVADASLSHGGAGGFRERALKMEAPCTARG
jgi:lysine 2,3-aminomutase